MFDEFTIDGEPLENACRIVEEWDDARTVGARRQTNVVVPNRNGEVWLPKSLEAKVFTVSMAVLGVDPKTGSNPPTMQARRAQFNENWRAFANLIANDTRPLTLGRTVVLPGNRIERHTAAGEIVGQVEPVMIGSADCRVAVSFKMLDGVWLTDWADTLDRMNGTPRGKLGGGVNDLAVSVLGDVTTWNIQVAFEGGTGTQTLTNLTTGDRVSYTGDTTVPVFLDVPAYTATQGDVSVIENVTSGDAQVSPFWMTLRPGPNQLQIDGGGKVRLRYRACVL
jgi:hypothetical protein